MADDKVTPKAKPMDKPGRYGKSPKIEPVESKGDTGKTVAREQAAGAAKATAGGGSPQAGMEIDDGPQASVDAGTDGIPVHEMHAREMKGMHDSHKREMADMHSRHRDEHGKMMAKHMKEMAQGPMPGDATAGQ